MQPSIKISFILTTYNKLAYLKVTLPYILEQLQADEELILVDGNSQDGTVGFISEKIKHIPNIHFISERDRGEADGLNKALALCKGRVIKNLTDDDAFSFSTIRIASDYLLEHNIDILGFDGYGLSLHEQEFNFPETDFKKDFDHYKISGQAFFFCGLSYLIKTASLERLGKFSVTHKMVDLEYSFRISSGTCKIGWCNLLMFVNIYNSNSNTLLLNKTLEKESIALHKKYRPFKDFLNVYLRFKLQRTLEFKNKLLKKESFGKTNKLNFEEGFYRSVELLEKENASLKEIRFYS